MSSDVISVSAYLVKIDDHLIINDRPCKVTGTKLVRGGKLGGYKSHFVGVDILNGNRHEFICKLTAMVQQPIITKTEYQICNNVASLAPSRVDSSKCKLESFVLNKQKDGAYRYVCSLFINGKLYENLTFSSDEVAAELIESLGEDRIIILTVMSVMGVEQIVAVKVID